MGNEQKLISGARGIVKLSPQSLDAGTVLGLWLDRMALMFKEDLTVEVIDMWGRALRDYEARAIDFGFEQYLKFGQPFMPKPCDVIRFAEDWRPAEGEKTGTSAGCQKCKWTGWVASMLQPNAVAKCECFFNPSLRTKKPEPERIDLGDISDAMMAKLKQTTEIPKE